MAVDKVTLLGLKEAQAAFKQLPDLAREAFNEAVETTAAHVVTLSQSRLTPGHGVRTGQLKKALGF